MACRLVPSSSRLLPAAFLNSLINPLLACPAEPSSFNLFTWRHKVIDRKLEKELGYFLAQKVYGTKSG